MRMQCVLMRWEDLTAPAIMATLEMDSCAVSHITRVTISDAFTYLKKSHNQIRSKQEI
jgi:hypothetical protein